ncbi:MAG TPA: hypothetical protein VEK15_09035 [Vicinamibacteria bacterium]|nr:hypothetical protein [Vicinamibacteria bacterium]
MGAPTGSFPDLRVVSIQDLLRHEDVDLERVARLLDRLSADGVLRNPPVVARLRQSQKFLLLDGANRVSALENLEIPHLLVQVEDFDDPALEVRHWNHVVRDIEARTLTRKVHDIPGIVARGGEPRRDGPDYLATISTGETASTHLYGGEGIGERVFYWRSIVEVYHRGDARMDRVSHDDIETLRSHHPHFGALVSFPDFRKEEIRTIAEAGERLPSGVTRILVPRRVLGFNLRLPLLKSSLPLEEKRRWLAEEIQHKVTEHKVRYYQEPTFVFDD